MFYCQWKRKIAILCRLFLQYIIEKRAWIYQWFDNKLAFSVFSSFFGSRYYQKKFVVTVFTRQSKIHIILIVVLIFYGVKWYLDLHAVAIVIAQVISTIVQVLSITVMCRCRKLVWPTAAQLPNNIYAPISQRVCDNVIFNLVVQVPCCADCI